MAPQPTQNAVADASNPQPKHEASKSAPGFKMLSPPKFDTPDEERKYLRERLAAAYRVFGRFGECVLRGENAARVK